MKRLFLSILAVLSLSFSASSGDGDAFFQINRPNYFVAGLPFDKEADKNTCDVKYQFSVRISLLLEHIQGRACCVSA